MIAELLQDIGYRLALVPALENAEIRVATNARFDSLVEGCLHVVVSPQTVLYDQETRDGVKETTTVEIALAEYFADKNEERALALLDIIPQIEQMFTGLDIPVGGALYRWDSALAYGDATSNRVRETPGGLLDVDAADKAYIYQAPVYLTYVRHLRGIKPKAATIRDFPKNAEPPKKIYAPASMRVALVVVGDDGSIMTNALYKSGILRFV